mmetsp:Transcript_21850/g.41679  ORF Transcript_21850/g.41679 Transcript_21850/m.41679 type:complete len:312 (-) Transcript_21850:303-1238(-)
MLSQRETLQLKAFALLVEGVLQRLDLFVLGDDLSIEVHLHLPQLLDADLVFVNFPVQRCRSNRRLVLHRNLRLLNSLHHGVLELGELQHHVLKGELHHLLLNYLCAVPRHCMHGIAQQTLQASSRHLAQLCQLALGGRDVHFLGIHMLTVGLVHTVHFVQRTSNNVLYEFKCCLWTLDGEVMDGLQGEGEKRPRLDAKGVTLVGDVGNDALPNGVARLAEGVGGPRSVAHLQAAGEQHEHELGLVPGIEHAHALGEVRDARHREQLVQLLRSHISDQRGVREVVEHFTHFVDVLHWVRQELLVSPAGRTYG